MIIRIEKNQDYTTISNVALNDPNLSLKAKGLWAFIMSKHDTWTITYRGLSSQLQEGQSAILGALKELEVAGYLVRGRVREQGGTFGQGDGTLYENPCLEKPCVENPRVDSSRTKVNTNKVITDKETTIAKAIVEPKIGYGKPEINELFVYWQDTLGYPIQSAKQKNRFACNNLLNQYGLEVVRELVKGAAAAAADPYGPRISDFCDLQANLNKLILWGKKRNQNGQSVTAIG